ncbi:MAG: type II toxin-antitoxin system VapC family toxin [Actinomycetota bacterium]|nr:type II toxin-antitoxin system VapC family toxin [Actinomycetota bacterium]
MTASDEGGVTLLDVNVLVALAWPSHVHHATAHAWFSQHQPLGWATCPTTENGFVRVSSNAAVIPHAVPPAAAIELLDQITRVDGHQFWADDVRGVVGAQLDRALVVGHRQVSDAHLLALALSRGGALATLDRAVRGLAPRGRASAVLSLL